MVERAGGDGTGDASIDALIQRMDAVETELVEARDRARIFHATYNRITHAVRDEIRRGGFSDGGWVERWDVAFAGLYLTALEAWRSGREPPAPWATAFGASRTRLAPLRHVLLGMNAHINYDLPQALLAVIDDADFGDPAVMALRERDHRHVDTVLGAQVAAEDELLKVEEEPGDRTWVDQLIKPFNRWGTRRFLRESRLKVWANTRVLADARRAGDDRYGQVLAELEVLTERKVESLLQPGHVLLRLAREGFGVTLR